MSMEPVLLGTAVAPAIASSANAAGQAVDKVSESFQNILQSAGDLLSHSDKKGVADITDSGAPISIVEIQTYFSQLKTDVEQRIEKVLTDAGINLDSSLRISLSDADGSLEVVGAHPQRAAIEAALNSDQDLAVDFQALSVEQDLLELFARDRSAAEEFAKQPRQTMLNEAGRSIKRPRALLELSSSNELQLQFE